jgi:hypothetical protein
MVDLHWLFRVDAPSITEKATVSSRTGTCRQRKASTGSWAAKGRQVKVRAYRVRGISAAISFATPSASATPVAAPVGLSGRTGRASGRAIGSDAMAAANLRHADAWFLRLLYRPFLLATEATGGSTGGPLLAISAWLGFRRGTRRVASGSRRAGGSIAAGETASRLDLDDGCSLSRDRSGDRASARSGDAGRRDGGCGPLRFRHDERQLDRLLRSCHELDGADRGRLREGQGRRRQGHARCRRRRGARVAKL